MGAGTSAGGTASAAIRRRTAPDRLEDHCGRRALDRWKARKAGQGVVSWSASHARGASCSVEVFADVERRERYSERVTALTEQSMHRLENARRLERITTKSFAPAWMAATTMVRSLSPAALGSGSGDPCRSTVPLDTAMSASRVHRDEIGLELAENFDRWAESACRSPSNPWVGCRNHRPHEDSVVAEGTVWPQSHPLRLRLGRSRFETRRTARPEVERGSRPALSVVWQSSLVHSIATRNSCMAAQEIYPARRRHFITRRLHHGKPARRTSPCPKTKAPQGNDGGSPRLAKPRTDGKPLGADATHTGHARPRRHHSVDT